MDNARTCRDTWFCSFPEELSGKMTLTHLVNSEVINVLLGPGHDQLCLFGDRHCQHKTAFTLEFILEPNTSACGLRTDSGYPKYSALLWWSSHEVFIVKGNRKLKVKTLLKSIGGNIRQAALTKWGTPPIGLRCSLTFLASRSVEARGLLIYCHKKQKSEVTSVNCATYMAFRNESWLFLSKTRRAALLSSISQEWC